LYAAYVSHSYLVVFDIHLLSPPSEMIQFAVSVFYRRRRTQKKNRVRRTATFWLW